MTKAQVWIQIVSSCLRHVLTSLPFYFLPAGDKEEKNRPAFYNITVTWPDEAFKRYKSTRFVLKFN